MVVGYVGARVSGRGKAPGRPAAAGGLVWTCVCVSEEQLCLVARAHGRLRFMLICGCYVHVWWGGAVLATGIPTKMVDVVR